MRHAEPLVSNGQRRFIGHSDPALSPAGADRASRLAERLHPLGLDAVYSSDLRRCLATAEIIAREAIPAPSAAVSRVRVDPRLREIDTGLWEALTFEEAKRLYPREHAERERDLTGYRFPGGESFRDLRDRVVPAFWDIAGEGAAKVLIVAHRGVNRVLLGEFLGLPLERLFSIRQDHGQMALLRASAPSGGARRIEVLSTDLGSDLEGPGHRSAE